MPITSVQKELLFVLGEYLSRTTTRFSSAPLKVCILKADFIDTAKKLKLLNKSTRAIYKNLQDAQKARLIQYKGDGLCLTKKGHSLYKKLKTDYLKFKKVTKTVEKNKIKFKRKSQTKLVY